MKKLLSLVLSLALVCGALVGLTACGDNGNSTGSGDGETKLKVGLICLHNSDSTYDKNFIDAFEYACKKKGVDYIIKTDVPEDEKCSAAAEDFVDQGCNIIFSDSYGHQGFMKGVAAENPNVVFCSATGDTAHTDGLPNFYNAFASIYEGRFLAGIAAGEKLKEMLAENKLTDKNYNEAGKVLIGYVGAYTYAEVKSGYTSYYLGVKHSLSKFNETYTEDKKLDVEMLVQFTGSWCDENLEKEAANTLIGKGCAVLSQHADSMGAPSACETAGVPDISYNGSTVEACPNTFIVSSRINWAPYYEYVIDCVKNGKTIQQDWVGQLGTDYEEDLTNLDNTGSVCLTALGGKAAATTKAAIDEAFAALKAGTLKVFDLSKFTVKGEPLSKDYMADVNADKDFTVDTKVVKEANGITYFAESEFRAAPYFNVDIDGIVLLNTKF